MRTLFLLLLSCLPCLAQFGVEQPMFALTSTAAAPYSVTNDPRLQYHWSYLDLATGRITSWTDRKQGLVSTSYGVTTGPTNTTNGLVFVGGTRSVILTNPPISYGTNQAVALIWKPIERPNTFNFAASSTNPYPQLDWLPAGSTYLAGFHFGSSPYTMTVGNYYWTNWHDITFVYTNNPPNKYVTTYTNGVFSTSVNFTTELGSYYSLINIGGQAAAPGDIYQAPIVFKDIMVFTNALEHSILASNVHYFRTNVYGTAL